MKKKLNDILVLNRHWCPIHIIDYKRAMRLIYLDNAHSLDMDYLIYDYSNWLDLSKTDTHFKRIRTVSESIALPEIVVLVHFNSLPSRDVKYSRENVFARDNYTCMYCGKKFQKKALTIDHIYPRHLGGKSTWDNVACSCKPCNSAKGGHTLKECHMRLIKKPTRPKWLNPLSKTHPDHMCKSWSKFMKRVETHDVDQ